MARIESGGLGANAASPRPTNRPVSLLLLITISTVLLRSQALAEPADWGESDWYKFIEMTISVSLDKLHGGIEQVPKWMKNKTPVKGRLPLVDAYSALSGAGSAVKPGLRSYLYRRMEDAAEADDYNRLNGYQAYLSALDGHPARLRELQRKAQAALDKEEAKARAQSLVLNNLLASVDSSRRIEIVPQFTVGGNEDATLDKLQGQATVRGPKTSFSQSVDIPLSQPRGYQAAQFSLALPASSPSGRYTVDLSLSDARGLSSDSRTASFEYKAPAPPKESPEPPEPTKTEDPPHPSEPEKGPTKPELSRGFSVAIVGPPGGKVGSKLAFVPDLGGKPVGTVEYRWTFPSGTSRARSLVHQFDSVGSKEVRLVATDSAGHQATARTTVSIQDEKLQVQLLGPSASPVGTIVNLSSRIQGGTPPYTYSWTTDGKRWLTETVTLDYDTPGNKAVELSVVDSRGLKGEGSLQIAVKDGIAVNVAGPREARVGRAVTYTPVVMTGPNSGFHFSWSVDGQTGQGESFSPVFKTAGRKTLVCLAKHPDYPAYQSKASITVEEAVLDTADGPLAVEILGPTELDAGKMGTFTASVKGGVPPYRYVWTAKGKSIPKKQITGSFHQPGQHFLVLKVIDSGGDKVASATTSLTVNVSESKGMSVKIQGPTKTVVGETVTFSPTVSGGTGPYRYVWTVKGKAIQKETIQGSFDKEGNQSVGLAVYDHGAEGAQPVRVSRSITVSAERGTDSGKSAERPDDGTPVTFDEFVGTYTVTAKTNWGMVPSEWPNLFRADGVWGQLGKGGAITHRARWKLENGVLTVQKTDSTSYWNYHKSGPITRYHSGFKWTYRSRKRPSDEVTIIFY